MSAPYIQNSVKFWVSAAQQGRREAPIIVKFSREEHTVRAICRCKMGDPAPLKRGTSPHFLAHVYCGQTAGWIKMPLGMEVGLGPCHILLDGDPARPKRGHIRPPSLFAQCLLLPNGWMDQDATWYGGRPRPGPHCVGWGSSSPPLKKEGAFHQFLAHVYCGQMAAWIYDSWYRGRLQPRPHCVIWGPSSHLKGAQPPNFWPMSVVAK